MHHEWIHSPTQKKKDILFFDSGLLISNILKIYIYTLHQAQLQHFSTKNKLYVSNSEKMKDWNWKVKRFIKLAHNIFR